MYDTTKLVARVEDLLADRGEMYRHTCAAGAPRPRLLTSSVTMDGLSAVSKMEDFSAGVGSRAGAPALHWDKTLTFFRARWR